MTSRRSYRSAWQLLVAAFGCALVGAVAFFSLWKASFLVLLALAAGLIALAASVVLLLKAINEDPSLTAEETRSLQTKLLLFGPLGALDILLSRRQK